VDLLARWRRKPVDEQQDVLRSVAQLRVLRASGQRIDLSARDVGMRIAATRQSWQQDAWDYHGRIGELAFALRQLAQQVAKVRFYAAEIRPYPEDPIELTNDDHDVDPQLAADAVGNLARLPLDDESIDGFKATICRNLNVAGEGWIHGEPDGGGESWQVRSISEIIPRGDEVYLSELPTATSLGQRKITDSEVLMRCWLRHPRWTQLADSPLSSTLDILEGIVLDGREMRVAAQSRIAANGILLVPSEISLTRVIEDAQGLREESVTDEEFMAGLVDAMTAPIRNEGHPGAVAPMVMRGMAEHLKEVRHMKIDRADSQQIMERVAGGLLRMLKSIDIQPEQVEGLKSLNHWSGWQVEAKAAKDLAIPWSATVAGCIAKAFLRSALESVGYSRDALRRIGVWYDASKLTENPNKAQDARDAHDRIVISDERFRRDLGYDEDDAPDEEERNRRIAAKAGIDQGTAAAVLEIARYVSGRQLPRVIGQPGQNALPTGTATGDAHPPRPGETVPEEVIPTEPARQEQDRSMTAAAEQGHPLPGGWRVDMALSRDLADIDAALAERIITAADAAIARAIERAGGRARTALRSAARRDSALTAAIDGVDAAMIPGRVGRDVLLAATGLPELLAGAFTRLRSQFFDWLRLSAEQVASTVSRLLGARQQDRQRVVVDRLLERRDAAWTALAEELDAAAARAMFRADPLAPEQGRGEGSGALIEPPAVTRALTIAGGGHPDRITDSGLGSGPIVREVLAGAGAVTLGWEWQYRPERPRGAHFPPHVALDGARFSTWTDPVLATDESTAWVGTHFRPGDHEACRCTSRTIIAVPEPEEAELVSRRIQEAGESGRGRAAARLASEDVSAGRAGTSAQREIETRDRLAADVERLRQHYIEGVRSQ